MDTYNQETIFHLPGLFRYFDVYKQILDNMVVVLNSKSLSVNNSEIEETITK